RLCIGFPSCFYCMDGEVLFKAFKQQFHLPAVCVQVQDFLSTVSCIKRCDNHNPACAKQCLSPDFVLVFASFSDFSFRGLCCFVNREFMGNYPHKTSLLLIFSETKE